MAAGSRKPEKPGEMKRPPRETNPALLRQAMLRRLPRRLSGQGRIRLPAVPSLIEVYLQRLGATFAALGREFSAEDLSGLRKVLEPQLSAGFAASPFAHLLVTYRTDDPPAETLSYQVSLEVSTMSDEYAEWVASRTPPLFGPHPDAKVMALASSLGPPSTVTVLDVGAGTGRNTLPLARAGLITEAVEVAPALAAVLRQQVASSGLAVRIFEGDIFDSALEIPARHYQLVVLAEVVASHVRTTASLRAWFERLAGLVAPGGLLVLSAFLTAGGYQPDAMARELSQVFWSCLFTRRELLEASAGLSLELLSDESVFEYEKQHLPPEAWPPTGWFIEWTQGLDIFDLTGAEAPGQLRWLVYRKR
jgi:SAM-dependent methyltransferase